MAINNRCGAEYLPSPLASKAEFALTAEPLLAREGHMTAVAVAVENGHAVAFLGTANGEVEADAGFSSSSSGLSAVLVKAAWLPRALCRS